MFIYIPKDVGVNGIVARHADDFASDDLQHALPFAPIDGSEPK